MAKQLGLFTQASFNLTYDLKKSLRAVVDESGLGRDLFLDQLNELAARHGVRLQKGNGHKLTKALFDKWLNPADKERIPLPSAVTLICQVGQSIKPLEVMGAPVGATMIDEQDSKLLAWAKEYRKAAAARKAMKKLEAEI